MNWLLFLDIVAIATWIWALIHWAMYRRYLKEGLITVKPILLWMSWVPVAYFLARLLS